MNKYLSNKESLENLLMILGLHLIFFLSTFLLIKNLQLIFSLPLFVILSLIHHKFLGEFIHEGCHYNLHKNKIINEYISNYLVGLFFFVSVSNYRKKHFKHHEFEKYFKEDDPETGPLKIHKKKELWKNIFFDLIGLNGLLFLLNYTNLESSSRSKPLNSKFKFDKAFFVILFIQIIFCITAIFYNFLMFYLVYYLTLGTLYHLQLRFRIVCLCT
jgi:fatty acid desaturase